MQALDFSRESRLLISLSFLMSSLAAAYHGLPAPLSPKVDLLVIAGEHSGDQHAATMVREARRQSPSLSVAALGGPELAAAGAQLLHDLTSTSVVGFAEVLSNIGFFRRLFNDTLRWIETHRPAAVCFIDYPGFNLRIAKALRARGISKKSGGFCTTLFYISPQIWAWKPHRRFAMEQNLDALAVIFPFEVGCYADTELPVTFVGHPFVAPDYAPPVSLDPAGPVLLLPGSRSQTVKRIFPTLLKAYELLRDPREAVVLYPSEHIRQILASFNPPEKVRLHPTGSPVSASAVLTSSGTMSMHCALAGIPGAVVYKTSPATYTLGRMLVKTNFIGIANLLLKEPMYPEFIQKRAHPAVLAVELRHCLYDRTRRDHTLAEASRLRDILRQPSSGTAADWLLQKLTTSVGNY